MPLIHVANRLNSPDIDRIVAPFREPTASRRRAVLMLTALVWTIGWNQAAPDHFLAGEAHKVLPAMAVLTVLAIGWSVFANTYRHANRPWVDVAGTILDFSGLAVLFSMAWNLMIPFTGLLPLATVNTGTRFRPIWFYVAVLASIAIVFFTAPHGYWFSRPAVAVLAIVMLAGVPMTFNRILTSLSRISEQAILARDSQSRFLAMMSHELRTPLHSVINSASLLGAYTDERQRSTMVDSIVTNANVLLSRVNDMLDVAASQAGVVHVEAGEPFDLRAVMKTVQAVVNEQALDRNTMLTFMYDTDTPTVLHGNPRRLEQVITNLASNAIKYTPPGGSVVVTAAADQPALDSVDAELTITVADTGIGIPDAEKAKIFEPFTQLSSGQTRTHGGVGLGLHIIQQYSTRMNAKITVADNPGGGTIFTWRQTLPVGDSTKLPASDKSAAEVFEAHAASTPSMRCLIVDDNRSNREIMARILVQAGHRPSSVTDGEQAIRRLSEQHYDITFLDLHMPGLSGLDVLKVLREQRPAGRMPNIVILTASTELQVSQKALNLGAIGFLQKPLSIAATLEILSKLANDNAAIMRIKANPETNSVELMRRISDATTMRAFLANGIVELRDATEAIDVHGHIETDEERGRMVHRLKNALLNCGCSHRAIAEAGLTEGRYTEVQLRQLRPAIETLVVTAVAEVTAAPEMRDDWRHASP